MHVNYLFFFQAEDGIRDLYVTGVQTCALPISATGKNTSTREPNRMIPIRAPCVARSPRSEERRVGKECRSRRSPYPSKKKKEERRAAGRGVNNRIGRKNRGRRTKLS